jgi:hypothetical protein
MATRLRPALVAALLFAATTPAGVASAQSVRGTVVNEGNAPVPGVIVLLLDSASTIAARALTSEGGTFRLSAPRAGVYRTRTLRIGFRPMLSGTFQMDGGEEIVRRIVLSSVQFVLDTVKVQGRNECRMSSESAAATFAVWEQVQAALTAAQLTSDRRGITATTIGYERTLDRDGRRVLEQSTSMHVNTVRRLWRARSIDSLHTSGYVVRERDGSSWYFAPDIETLVSPVFLEDHCFRLTRGRDSSQVGIAFEPTPNRRRLPEIRGTMWLHRATSGLRRLEFRYVNLSPDEEAEARGEMDFVPARNGAWAIQRWSIRMPELTRTVQSATYGGGDIRLAQIKTSGGELALLRVGTDTLWARPPLQLVGTVSDSLSGAPVAGASVALVGTALAARTDAGGRFTLDGVLPGEYTMETRTPSLDSVNAVHSSPVVFTPTSPPASVHVASAASLVASLCGKAASEPGIIVGRMVLVRDTMPFHRLRVRAEWADGWLIREQGSGVRVQPDMRSVDARVDAGGTFRLCGIPLNTEVVVRVEADTVDGPSGVRRNATPVGLRITPAVRVARTELYVDPARRVGAVFTGVVLADSSERPVAGAEVVLPELSRSAITNATGVFRLTGIPEGRHQVTVRRIGFRSIGTAMEFQENRTLNRRITLRRTTVIDSVVTRADMVIPAFEENRRLGLGHVVTRAELEKLNANNLTDALSSFPSIGFVRGTGSAAWPLSRRPPAASGATPEWMYEPDNVERNQGMRTACYAQVYVDRQLMNPGKPTPGFDVNSILPSSVEGIEVYASRMQTPPPYNAANAMCGVVVIWTWRSRL